MDNGDNDSKFGGFFFGAEGGGVRSLAHDLESISNIDIKFTKREKNTFICIELQYPFYYS